MFVAHVFVEHPILHLDHTFTYLYHDMDVQRGVRVRVPFGSTSIIGFVMSTEELTQEQIDLYPYQLKEIMEVIDQESLLNEELFALAKWMAKTYVAPSISCFQAMLPAKMRPSSTMKKAKMEMWVRICKEADDALTPKQRLAYEGLAAAGEMLKKIFVQEYKTCAKKIIELGYAQTFEKEVNAVLKEVVSRDEEKVLTPDQQQAMKQFLDTKKVVSLLHGVTGSGKTEVFLQIASHVLAQGKQVMVLVPEISLTPQMVERVKRRFGKQVAIYHSRLNEQEKYEQYQLVKNHQVQIVVGTRSAIFMPYDHLGVIILDEEHDTSYKQDKTPRYHCRDIAIWRANYHHAKVLLASATPSLESYARAYKNQYELIELKHRINDQFPKINLIDMRHAIKNHEHFILSNALLDGIYDRLQKKEQVILLLNRRGYTPILRCISCGYVQLCPHCEVAMSYHKEENVLKCHTCGETMQVPNYCPSCGQASWRYLGLGTQKLEEFVQMKFPQARILRMDADTTGRKCSHEEMLDAFKEHQADILLGTQMIAKGLDFENVTLVGIVNGDAMLNRSDYRSAELTYDLLEQAAGRSGRGQKAGEVMVQVYDPNHYAIQAMLQHDYRMFFTTEMKFRHLAGYPPYRYLISFIFSSKKEEVVEQDVQMALCLLHKKSDCKVLGPAPLHKIKDAYRTRILVKGKNEALLANYAFEVFHQHLEKKAKSKLDIDVSPVVME